MIKTNSYVDDIIHSVESKEEALSLIEDIEKTLANGSFKIKRWVITGEDNSGMNMLEQDGEKVLGLNWECSSDVFYFRTKLNFSPKYKGVRKGPDLSKANFFENVSSVLTKRIVVSQMCSVFDPLGFLLPFTLRAKLLLRDTVKCDAKLGWDDPLPSHIKDKWVSHFYDLFGTDILVFERTVKPASANGMPVLIIFSDSSADAYGAVAYARWEVGSGKYESRIIMAKNRIATSRQLSIPRLELCGAIVSCRMRRIIEDEMTYKFSSVMHITDSAIVRAQI